MTTSISKILCVGEALWDNLPSGKQAGGAPMNVALHLKKLGHQVVLASRIGNDELGDELFSFLKKSGLNTDNIQIDELLPTSEVKAKLDEKNNAAYEIVENVAWDNLQSTERLRKTATESKVIVYGTLASRNKTTRDTIMSLLDNKNDGIKVIDANFRAPYTNKEVIDLLLSKADIIKLNDEELLALASWYEIYGSEQRLMSWVAEKYNTGMVIVTKGIDGSVALFNDKFYAHGGFKIKTVDTVGAGDSFLAGFLSSWLTDINPAKALQYAGATGACVASKLGATPDYSQEEISKILMQ